MNTANYTQLPTHDSRVIGGPPESAASRDAEVRGDAELQQRLSDLRAHVAALDSSGKAQRLVLEVTKSIEQLVTEHEGMANELLCLYEQIGIVFEVTRNVSGVKSEADVIDLFIDALQRSFHACHVFYTTAHSSIGVPVATQTGRQAPCAPNETAVETRDWMRRLVERARSKHRVLVEDAPRDPIPAVFCEVMVGPIFAGVRSETNPDEAFVGAIVLMRDNHTEAFHVSDMSLVESLATFCGDLIRNHRLVHELREMSISMVQSLVSAVDQKDPYTSGHSLRVGYYASMLGRQIGLSETDLQMLQWSALLHDVGKIGIRDDVLKKEGKLTSAEFDHIKEHPIRSHKVVREVSQLADALDGVLHHHEHYDGSGYPSALAGENIPLQARIIQIADVFDALTSNRSYRPAFGCQKALDIMQREAGTTIDPRLQVVFDELVRAAVENGASGWDDLVRRANAFTPLGDRGPQHGEGP